MAHDRVECFQTIAGDAQHDGMIRRNFPRSNQFLGHAHRHAAGSLGEYSFALRQQPDAVAHFVIRHIIGEAARFLHDFERVETIGRRANGE